MDRFIERCAGLDVHKASVKACVRIPDGGGGRHSETRTFRTTTAGLVLLRDWLTSHQIQVVGMESTGVFWKPVYYLLEDDLECWLLNAQHLKNVPGRKTDVADAAWIAQLLVAAPPTVGGGARDAHLVGDVGDRPSRLGGDPPDQGQPSRRRQAGVSVGHEASSERGAVTARTSLGGLTSRQQPLWAEQLTLAGAWCSPASTSGAVEP